VTVTLIYYRLSGQGAPAGGQNAPGAADSAGGGPGDWFGSS
jgi:hypothetical protein